MSSHFTYLLVNFFCMLIPLVFSFHPRIKFHRKFPQFLVACLLTAVFFITWDAVFTLMGVWSFNEKYITGLYLFHLPIEEILFFFCIPFACVFTYYSLRNFFGAEKYQQLARIVFLLLSLFLAAFALLNSEKIYTSSTFFFLSALIIFLLYLKVSFLPDFLLMYVIILLPFFLSNGFLTGMFTDEAVVIYNNEENTGIRMFTIPFEDLFYGMLLLLLNVSLFEFFCALSQRIRSVEGTQQR